MKLVFLYVQDRRDAKYMQSLPTEGYFWLLEKMVREKIVDEVTIVIVSGRSASYDFGVEGVNGLTVEKLGDIGAILQPGDVVWCRGGWKAWYKPLAQWKNKYWLLMYAANTGRQKWHIWDVIFDDLDRDEFLDGRKRFHLPWTKPTNPKLFYPISTVKVRPYDICIGASHIHDRKAQWRVIDALVELKRLTGRTPKCILPGAQRRGVQSNLIIPKIEKHGLDVEMPGMLSRESMCRVLNYSKLFVHLGGHGQNDRGPLEAMRCGCPVVIETPARHAPVVYECPDSVVTKNANDPKKMAAELIGLMASYTEQQRGRVREYYERVNGADVPVVEMKKLFDFFRAHPAPDTEALARHYGR